MSIATATLHTPEDLLKVTDRPMPDLVNGEFVEREPMGQEAVAVASRIIIKLGTYAEANLPAIINGAHGSFQIFPDDPQKVRVPDVSFTRKDRLPNGHPAKGHGRIVPDLVVEVISPNDLAADLYEKINDYQAAGVPLIWVAHPETRTVTPITHSGGGPALRVGDTLRGGDVLPGFECPVASLFD
jgi:Uma2 family endonuclease